MSHPITNNDVADILDALGKSEAAATVRWGETPAEVVERNELEDELAHAENMLADLESQLCKSCTKKWKDGQ